MSDDQTPNNTSSSIDETARAKFSKLLRLKSKGIDPYPHYFRPSHKSAHLHQQYADLANGEETQDVITVAGRIKAVRNSGMFIDLYDVSGKIQIYTALKDVVSAEHLEMLSLLDVGDIIGVKGIIRRSPRGELTINSQKFTMLTKSRRALPDKHHGLVDPETRYRSREADLIANEEARKVFRQRSAISHLLVCACWPASPPSPVLKALRR